jgi:hypothetical protein
MKTLIAVSGVGNRGKTTSINKAYKLLSQEYKVAVLQEKINHIGSRGGKDIAVILNINNVKIGITSIGDTPTALLPLLNTFTNEGCKIIICATRSDGGTVNAVNTFSKKYEIQWIEKSGVQDETKQEEDNKKTAKMIFELIKQALSC